MFPYAGPQAGNQFKNPALSLFQLEALASRLLLMELLTPEEAFWITQEVSAGKTKLFGHSNVYAMPALPGFLAGPMTGPQGEATKFTQAVWAADFDGVIAARGSMEELRCRVEGRAGNPFLPAFA